METNGVNTLAAQIGLYALNATREAALAASETIGHGTKDASDHAAVMAMRREFNNAPMAGRIVIGEGERDAAPMLYIGEKVGKGWNGDKLRPSFPEIDIAVDPLEGTNLCADGFAGAVSVMAASDKDGLLHAPDIYMEQLVVGPAARGLLDLEAPVKHNLTLLARALERPIGHLKVVILKRPRHNDLIREVREAGARVSLITDGDLSPGIEVALKRSGIHALMGIGGAPEAVLKAAALRCVNGEIQARFVRKEELIHQKDREKIPDDVEERIERMGIQNPWDIFDTERLAPGKRIVFCATGVTEGKLLKDARLFPTGDQTESVLMYREGTAHNVDFINGSRGSNDTVFSID